MPRKSSERQVPLFFPNVAAAREHRIATLVGKEYRIALEGHLFSFKTEYFFAGHGEIQFSADCLAGLRYFNWRSEPMSKTFSLADYLRRNEGQAKYACASRVMDNEYLADCRGPKILASLEAADNVRALQGVHWLGMHCIVIGLLTQEDSMQFFEKGKRPSFLVPVDV